LLARPLAAQTDSLPTAKPLLLEQKINLTRLELKNAFQTNDPASTGLWLDSLTRLNNEVYVTINWDERWLLYYWSENFGAVLSEAAEFGAHERTLEAYKVPAPNDSLFEIIDAAVLEKRFDIFQSIRHAFLNDEEKAFATLLLEYLLRLNNNEEDWADRLDNFMDKFPSSKYNYFINSVKPSILKPANKAFGFSGSFLSGTWSGELDRSVKPLFAGQIDAYYWVARWNVLGSFVFGGPRIARDISDGIEIWPKNDPTTFINFSLELGYDIINNQKVRIFPAIGGAIASLKPPSPDEESEEEPPPYYDNFTFFEGHLTTSLTADAKLFSKNYKNWDTPKGSYHGIRLKVAYNWLNFKGQNQQLAGNLFYVSVGYNFFAFREAKKR
jgi:hypothetical protein